MNKKFEELSPLERAIIGIEKRRWKYQGSKEKTIGAALSTAPNEGRRAPAVRQIN